MDDFNYMHILDRVKLCHYETEQQEKVKSINYDKYVPETVIKLRGSVRYTKPLEIPMNQNGEVNGIETERKILEEK